MSIQWQKSRLNWLWEGDANYKFFHGIMTSRRRTNALISIKVDDVHVEGVDGLRGVVFDNFKFAVNNRPSVEGWMFKLLFVQDGATLTFTFS